MPRTSSRTRPSSVAITSRRKCRTESSNTSPASLKFEKNFRCGSWTEELDRAFLGGCPSVLDEIGKGKPKVQIAPTGGVTRKSRRLRRQTDLWFRVSKQLIEGGLESVLNRKPRSSALVRMSANGLGSSERPTDKANLDLTRGGYLDERCP